MSEEKDRIERTEKECERGESIEQRQEAELSPDNLRKVVGGSGVAGLIFYP